MIAQLNIQTASKDGKTYLEQSFFTPPFKVANITEDKGAAWLHLMIMNSSPGILDGDSYSIRIDVGANSFLNLHTQSYQRLFNMKNGAAQLTEVVLQANSSFIYLPHPAVPHENSNFTARNKIFLTADCNLLWGEVLTCGRKLSKGVIASEVFRFSKYHSITEIFNNNKLIIKENLLMQPAMINPNSMGQLEGYTHQATLVCISNKMDNNGFKDEVVEYLESQEDIMSGISSTAGNGVIVRILGYGAEKLYEQLKNIAFISQQQKSKQPVKPVYAD
jgi:urease accessory protein